MSNTTDDNNTQAFIARPKPLSWHQSGKNWQAQSALGVFTITRMERDTKNVNPNNLWVASLNDAPFPIISPDADGAKDLAVLGQIAHNDIVIDLNWREETGCWIASGLSGAGPTTWVVYPSEGSAGWVSMRNSQPAFLPLADLEYAMAACDQYTAYVWLALSIVLGPAPKTS